MTASTTTRPVRLGTRPNPMAMEQTTRFAQAFRTQYPDITLDILKITSQGDQHRGPLSQIGGKGAFTRRAVEHLRDGRVEATIACAKDLPGPHDRAPGIAVGAVLPREDVRDVLVLPVGHLPATLARPAARHPGRHQRTPTGSLLRTLYRSSCRWPSAATPTAAWLPWTPARSAWT
ncbi:hypothetical protein ACZ90_67405 [Streptomyces albus subsp. albus]|nr:hypothetical protein ACZ90_67405 [Streptomyces albus subsp. albus]